MTKPLTPEHSGSSALGAYTSTEKLLACRFAARDLSLFSRKLSTSMLSGSSRTRFRGRGVDFEEVRLYQPGDDIRAIDWRVTARTQVAHTKLYSEERERPVFFVVDQRSAMFFGSQRCFKSVLACHIASTLAWTALANSDRVGALVFGDSSQKDIRPKRSKHAVLELINQLDDYNHKLNSPVGGVRPISMATMLEDARRIAKPGSAIFVISDLHDFDRDCEQQLHLLGRHCDVSLIQTLDPLETQLPNLGWLTITDGHKRSQINCRSEKLRTRFNHQQQQQQTLILGSCQKTQVNLMSMSTHHDSIEQLRDAFGNAKAARKRNTKLANAQASEAKQRTPTGAHL